MNSLTSKAFWAATGERAAIVFAASLASLIGYGAIAITAIAWIPDLEIAATAALLTVLHAISTTRPVVVPEAPAATTAHIDELKTYADSASA